MSDASSWLPGLTGPIDYQIDGAESDVPKRATVNIIGATVEDNPDNERTNITVGGFVAPTGTGVATTTGGALDAASSIGTALQVLRTNAGATDVEWAAASGTPGGSDKAIQYNNATAMAGSAVFSIDESLQEMGGVAANNSTLIRLKNYSAATANGANIVVNKARGTLASPTKAISGDTLGGFNARGWYEDGTPAFGPSTANGFTFKADQDFTSTTMGSYFALLLCPIGGATAAEVLRVSGYGKVTITGKAATSGVTGLFLATAAAHTGQTAATEVNDVLWDGSATLQFATGTVVTQRQNLIKARTYSGVGAMGITKAATLAIDKAPVAGTNVTITNAYALWVQAGLAQFDGPVAMGGSAINTYVYFNDSGVVGTDSYLSYNKATTKLTTFAIQADGTVTATLGLVSDSLNASGGTLSLKSLGVTCITQTTTLCTVTTPIASGTTPATAGQVRIPNATYLASRNVANSANINLVGMNGASQIVVGDATAATSVILMNQGTGDSSWSCTGELALTSGSGQPLHLYSGATEALQATSTAVQMGAPVIGLSSPYAGLNGLFSKTLTAAQSYDLVSSEYKYSILKFVSNGANIVRLPPATDVQAYMKFIWNASGGGTISVRDTNAVSATNTIPSGSGAWFLFSASSVKRITADFTVA